MSQERIDANFRYGRLGQPERIAETGEVLTDLGRIPRAERSCGQCTLCCTVIAVPELGKRALVPCAHECAGRGCGIYAMRPKACATVRCAWLDGLGASADRPDRTGVFFLPAVNPHPDDPPTLVGYESREGNAARGRPALFIAHARREGFKVVIVPHAVLRAGGTSAILATPREG